MFLKVELFCYCRLIDGIIFKQAQFVEDNVFRSRRYLCILRNWAIIVIEIQGRIYKRALQLAKLPEQQACGRKGDDYCSMRLN